MTAQIIHFPPPKLAPVNPPSLWGFGVELMREQQRESILSRPEPIFAKPVIEEKKGL